MDCLSSSSMRERNRKSSRSGDTDSLNIFDNPLVVMLNHG